MKEKEEEDTDRQSEELLFVQMADYFFFKVIHSCNGLVSHPHCVIERLMMMLDDGAMTPFSITDF